MRLFSRSYLLRSAVKLPILAAPLRPGRRGCVGGATNTCGGGTCGGGATNTSWCGTCSGLTTGCGGGGGSRLEGGGSRLDVGGGLQTGGWRLTAGNGGLTAGGGLGGAGLIAIGGGLTASDIVESVNGVVAFVLNPLAMMILVVMSELAIHFHISDSGGWSFWFCVLSS